MSDDLYIDYAASSTRIGDRTVSSFFTPYGIKCIDSEYSRRIKNINSHVTKLILVERKPHYFNGDYRSDYWDDYSELPLDNGFHSYDRISFIHEDIICFRELEDNRTEKGKSNGIQYQQFELTTPIYAYTHPIYSAKHEGEDPKKLKQEIKGNPHLHPKIKENLLLNLKSYLNGRDKKNI